MKAPSSSKVLIRNGPPTHVSIRTVMELENVLIHEAGMSTLPEKEQDFWQRVFYRMNRLTAWPFRALAKRHSAKELLFAVLMGVDHIRKVFPYFHHKARKKGSYVFDCWPSKYERMAEEVERYGIDPLFLSSWEAARAMKERLPDHPRILHIPEGIDPSPYRPAPFEEKDIDVLQFGRKHPSYHAALKEGLEDPSISYLYEEEKGELLFPDLDDFIRGLGRARISVCFPASDTHPGISGGVSTLTQRYLQSMLSKCLVVGSMPEDAKGLLPDDAVIEADREDPAGQVRRLLEDFEDHIPLIERNYELVLRKHTWSERVGRMMPYL
ncbi:MAG: glycosyltransferase [Flavobacteriales bacterium]